MSAYACPTCGSDAPLSQSCPVCDKKPLYMPLPIEATRATLARLEATRLLLAVKTELVNQKNREIQRLTSRRREAMADKLSWQSDRPTAGKWWVAIHPDCRTSDDDVMPIAVEIVFQICVYTATDERLAEAPQIMFRRKFEDDLDGALWLPREVPADPFAIGVEE